MHSITALSTLRMGVGFTFLALPELAAKLALMPVIPGATLVSRMAGTRDLAVGALTLYVAREAFGKNKTQTNSNGIVGASSASASAAKHGTNASSPLLNAVTEHGAASAATTTTTTNAHHRQGINAHVLGPVLAMNIAVDAMDILTCLWCFEQGNLAWQPALMIGGGAAILMDLGIFAMMRRKKLLAGLART